MSYPISGSVTITSSAASVNPTAGIPLDPTVRATSLQLSGMGTVTSTSTAATPVGGAFQVQITLDTFQAFSASSGGSSQVWQNCSSIVYTSTQVDGAFISILGPIAGARIFSSGTTSAAWSGTVVLKSLQSLTAGP